MHWALREFIVIFIGCSMSDPLIRRALYRTRLERMRDWKAKRAGRSEPSESESRRHFAVTCQSEKGSAVDRLIDKSWSQLGIWPLWVRDYEGDMCRRSGGLRDMLRLPRSGRAKCRQSCDTAARCPDPTWIRINLAGPTAARRRARFLIHTLGRSPQQGDEHDNSNAPMDCPRPAGGGDPHPGARPAGADARAGADPRPRATSSVRASRPKPAPSWSTAAWP